MPRLVTITPGKTYATPENAVKAVDKFCEGAEGQRLENFNNLSYFIHREESTGRYFPVFIGERACHAMMHFHFNVVA